MGAAAALWLAAPILTTGCEPRRSDLELVGSVERTLVELSAPTSEVLWSIEVERGERVRAGQVLMRLDPALAEAEVARAEAAVASGRTRALVAAHDLERLEDLRRRAVVSEQDLEHAELGRDEASAALREAGALLASARKRLRDLTLVSPVAGVVDQLPYEAGERVPVGAVLAVLLSDEPPWVRVWVPETAVARVGPGTPARVRVDGLPGEMAGRVLDVAREPEFTPHYALTERDRVHLVYEARVALVDAPESLRPGVAADVLLLPDGRPPATARSAPPSEPPPEPVAARDAEAESAAP